MNEVKLFQKSNYYKRDRKINSTMPSLFVKFDGHQFTLNLEGTTFKTGDCKVEMRSRHASFKERFENTYNIYLLFIELILYNNLTNATQM